MDYVDYLDHGDTDDDHDDHDVDVSTQKKTSWVKVVIGHAIAGRFVSALLNSKVIPLLAFHDREYLLLSFSFASFFLSFIAMSKLKEKNIQLKLHKKKKML